MTYFPVTVTVCYLLVGQNMLRKMLEKVTKARCVWVSSQMPLKAVKLDPHQKVDCTFLRLMAIVQSGLSKLRFIFQVGVKSFCIMAVALQLGHLLQVTINKVSCQWNSTQKLRSQILGTILYSVKPFNLMWLQLWLLKLLGFRCSSSDAHACGRKRFLWNWISIDNQSLRQPWI